MKRIITMLVLAVALFGITACGYTPPVENQIVNVPGLGRVERVVWEGGEALFTVRLTNEFAASQGWQETEMRFIISRAAGTDKLVLESVNYVSQLDSRGSSVIISSMGPKHPSRKLWDDRLEKIVVASKGALN